MITAEESGYRRPGRVRLGRRSLIALAALVALLGGGWLWLRDSPLVAVKHVTIVDDNGPDAGRIRSALIAAARRMTTLDVNVGALQAAVSAYPVVQGLHVDTSFPHGLRIVVVEDVPLATLSAGGRSVLVNAAGNVLSGRAGAAALPSIPVSAMPSSNRVSDPGALEDVAVLAAAPYAMLVHVAQVSQVGGHGVIAQLRGGPQVIFGDASELGAKWAAVTAVLANPGSAGAAYIDVTDPTRPAAGAGLTSTTSTAPPGG
ncbi:MAG: cell division protein FtsQ/DivIB [Solirubrobacteraceae bacterium]